MKREAKIFRTLADETRLRILALMQEGELCVCELTAALELPQSTISRHLAYLRNNGIVLDRRQGIWMYYRLDDGAERFIQELTGLLQHRLAGDPGHRQALQRLQAFRQEQARRVC